MHGTGACPGGWSCLAVKHTDLVLFVFHKSGFSSRRSIHRSAWWDALLRSRSALFETALPAAALLLSSTELQSILTRKYSSPPALETSWISLTGCKVLPFICIYNTLLHGGKGLSAKAESHFQWNPANTILHPLYRNQASFAKVTYHRAWKGPSERCG